MDPSIELAQAMIEFLAFFLPTFVIFLAIEWVIGLFRRSS